MFEILATAVANLIIGITVGLSGIAGFLLPIFYTDLLNYPLNLSLTLSFLAFSVSGIVGALNYKRLNNFNTKIAVKLSIASIVGAFIGSKINLLLDPMLAKRLLYGMILFSGLMLIKGNKEPNNGEINAEDKISKNTLLLFIVGVLTSIICSLTGAGGPILTVPILILLGIQTKTAIGIALFQSIFIAIPSILNYGSKIDVGNCWNMAIVIVISHAIGVLIGSKLTAKINHNILKKTIAYMTVVIAIFLFIKLG